VLQEPKIGIVATTGLIVSEADLASALRFEATDVYPPVFATSRMVALMEVASSRILTPLLELNELSVGVAIDVSHTAPTPANVKVKATAQYTGRDGKLFVFEVTACDAGGEIGRGTHKRAVIVTDRLVQRAISRVRDHVCISRTGTGRLNTNQDTWQRLKNLALFKLPVTDEQRNRLLPLIALITFIISLLLAIAYLLS
jgi:fluoroacetyl-CoA thioesterase